MLTWEDKWNEAKKKLLDIIEYNKIDHKKIVCSFSGGKDSTLLLLLLLEELGLKNKVKVVFFNTFMEYEVIYKFIENKRQAGWVIEETKPKLPAPLIYKKYGIPFQSKKTSDMLYRLQQHNFDFKNDSFKSFEELYNLYPKCKSALVWWSGKNIKINAPLWLKKELSNNGLNFKVANKCCEYLKKRPVYEFNKKNKTELSIIGIRKAEGGARENIYKGCTIFHKKEKLIKYFPLFWFTNEDMEQIIKAKNVELCEAYTKYGLNRTGCIGCPFGKDCNKELDILKLYEPNKYNACLNLFKDSYALKNKKDI